MQTIPTNLGPPPTEPQPFIDVEMEFEDVAFTIRCKTAEAILPMAPPRTYVLMDEGLGMQRSTDDDREIILGECQVLGAKLKESETPRTPGAAWYTRPVKMVATWTGWNRG